MVQGDRRLLVALMLLALPVVGRAVDEVVRDCSSDAELRAKLFDMQLTDGTLTFDCGTSPREIVLAGGELPSIASVMTIDGGGKITLNGGGTERIFFVSNLADLTLQNIVLTNAGTATNGGAIVDAGNLLLRNVQILNSRAGSKGGAIQVLPSSALTIVDSRLAGNTAAAGGAISTGGFGTGRKTVSISNSVLHDNRATAGSALGGAILLEENVDASIEGGELYNNSAAAGGAITSMFTSSQLVVRGTVIRDNDATAGSGGGIRLGPAGGSGSGASATLIDVTLSGNTAGGGLLDFPSGGGIYGDASSLTLERVTLSGNAAANRGGGIYLANPLPSSELVNVTISGNSTGIDGGGMYVGNGDVTLTNVTVVGNSASGGGGTASCQAGGG